MLAVSLLGAVLTSGCALGGNASGRAAGCVCSDAVGNRYLQSDDGGPLRLVKRGTDIPVVIRPHTESDAQLGFDDLEIASNGNWIERMRA